MTTFPERLKMLIAALGLTQRQFALAINIDAGYFSRIIQGKSIPPDRILLLIEGVFEVNRSWLETGQGAMFTDEGESPLKKLLIEAVKQLDESQVKLALAFLDYLTENDGVATDKDGE